MKVTFPKPPLDLLKELAGLFIRLGLTSFGGPAVHIAMMEEEFVRRRKWLTQEEFLDLLGATNLIPGPNSTEMAIHIGRERAGTWGLLVAGISFIFPAMAIVLALAWLYVSYGMLPQSQGLFYGMKPVLIAIILQAIWSLSKKFLRSPLLLTVSVFAAVMSLMQISEIGILILCGSLVLFVQKSKTSSKGLTLFSLTPAPFLFPDQLGALFLFFLKVGSVLYGSGYVLLAFLKSGLVDHHGWITQNQLLDAITVGQFTPGPVFTTATFIGFIIARWPGAVLATIGIFLPSFLLVAASGKLIPWIRKSNLTSAFLNGVNAASLGLMVAVTIQISKQALIDVPTIGLALISTFLVIRYRLNSIWLILGGASIGILKLFLGL